MNNYLIYDSEVTITKSFNRLANPLDFRNYIVAYAVKSSNELYPWCEYIENHDLDRLKQIFSRHELLIGHNIKFDMLYLWKYEWFQRWLFMGGRIWDTQLAQYVLTGQQVSLKQGKGCSLRVLAESVGAPKREKYMEEYWERGECTSNIPRHIVEQDVTSDVMDTEILYLAQRKLLTPEKENLIDLYMDALLATTEMEYNGFRINLEQGLKDREVLREELKLVDFHIIDLIDQKTDWPKNISFNPASNDHTSIVLFGGIIKNLEIVNQVNDDGVPLVFKTGERKGQVKTKKDRIIYQIKGLNANIKKTVEAKKEGIYSVADGALQALLTNSKKSVREFCELMIQRRSISKLLDTYYVGMLDLVYMRDKCVHPEYQHTLIETGRLSCKNPNLQNIPR